MTVVLPARSFGYDNAGNTTSDSTSCTSTLGAMSLTIFLAIAIAIRVLLDLTGMVMSNWRLDIAYCALFAGAAFALLSDDRRDLLGYGCVLLSAAWGVKAVIVFKRQAKNRTADH